MSKPLLKKMGIALGIYTLFIASIWLYLYQPTQQIQTSWEHELDLYLDRSTQLTALLNDFGYGGFIDSFRSFLRNKDIADLDNAISTLQQALIRLEHLKAQSHNQEFETLIQTIIEATKDYHATALTMKHNIALSAMMSYAILKRKITVQNQDVLSALEQLVTSNAETLKEVKLKTTFLKASHDKALIYWTLLASLLYLIVASILILAYRSMHQAFGQLKILNEFSPTATLLFDQNGQILQVNTAFRNVFSIEHDHSPKQLKLNHLLPSVYEQARSLFEDENKLNEHKKLPNFFVEGKRMCNAIVHVEVSLSVIKQDGKSFIFSIIHDKTNEEKLQHQARTDGLTQVFNRGYGEELLDLELKRVERNGQAFCVMILDVDYFKKVNDSLGHTAGDVLLKQLVSMLKDHLRKSDVIIRWGGDEFLIILPETQYKYAETVAEKIVRQAQFSFKDASVPTSVSIGAAMSEPNDSINKLVNRADEALYETKLRGRNGYTFFTDLSEPLTGSV